MLYLAVLYRLSAKTFEKRYVLLSAILAGVLMVAKLVLTSSACRKPFCMDIVSMLSPSPPSMQMTTLAMPLPIMEVDSLFFAFPSKRDGSRS